MSNNERGKRGSRGFGHVMRQRLERADLTHGTPRQLELIKAGIGRKLEMSNHGGTIYAVAAVELFGRSIRLGRDLTDKGAIVDPQYLRTDSEQSFGTAVLVELALIAEIRKCLMSENKIVEPTSTVELSMSDKIENAIQIMRNRAYRSDKGTVNYNNKIVAEVFNEDCPDVDIKTAIGIGSGRGLFVHVGGRSIRTNESHDAKNKDNKKKSDTTAADRIAIARIAEKELNRKHRETVAAVLAPVPAADVPVPVLAAVLAPVAADVAAVKRAK